MCEDIVIKANPKYLSALKAQTKINRRRLLDGDWLAVPEGSQAFERRFLNKLDKRPTDVVSIGRAWDTASEEPSDKNRYPDFTASVKMLKTKDGEIVIVGDFEPDSFEEKTQVYGKYRLRSGARDKAMLRQMQWDGSESQVILAVDPASAGKFQFREQSKQFRQEGFTVHADPMPNNKSKFLKFEPFATACQQGLVSIVESSFPNKQTLEAFYKELEQFDGERSTGTKKDDVADSAASIYNWLIKARVIKPFSVPNCASSASRLSEHNRRTR